VANGVQRKRDERHESLAARGVRRRCSLLPASVRVGSSVIEGFANET
jgi:hypothetical protein